MTILADPNLELVGLWVHSQAKEGTDAGQLVGAQPTGVLATRSTADIVGLDADCVLFMAADPEISDATVSGSHGERILNDLCVLLESGKNVVSTSLLPMVWPSDHWAPVVERFKKAAQAGDASIYFTGIHPGYLFDRLPLMISAITPRAEKISFRCMLSNWALYNDMQTLRSRGFGLLPAEFDAAGLRTIDETSDWIREMAISQRALCAALGAQVEEFRGRVDYAVTPSDIEIAAGTIPAGTVGAVHFTLEAISGGKTRVFSEQAISLDDTLLAQYGVWEDPETPGGVEFTIEGDVPIHARIGFGSHERPFLIESLVGTVAAAVNSIDATCQAEPGVYNFADIPPAFTRWA